jgi:D-alanine-D-alanine ligase-like ATP-grasp enzyme
MPACPNAFELFGADVMLDSNGQPWLLEMNSSPSMGMDTPLDRCVFGGAL